MHVSKVLGAALLGAATSSPVGGKREDSFQNEMIASHNYFRAQHSADDLVWDENIAQDAQNWANTCNFYHDVSNPLSPRPKGALLAHSPP